MRKSTARCSVMLLAIFLIALFLASVELVSPTWVDCRESLRFREDCGDPDMPDCAGPGSRAIAGTSSMPSGTDKPSEIRSLSEQNTQLDKANRSEDVPFGTQRTMIILRLWASVASSVFAF